jgi:hypothetical protein
MVLRFILGLRRFGGEVWHPGCFCEACEKKGFAGARVRKCVKRQEIKRAKSEIRKAESGPSQLGAGRRGRRVGVEAERKEVQGRRMRGEARWRLS